MYFRNKLLLLLTFYAIISCKNNKIDELTFKPVAIVNSKEISSEDFSQFYIKHLILTGKNDTKLNRYAYLNELIDKLILSDEAKNNLLHTTTEFKSFSEREYKKSFRDFYFYDLMNAISIPISEDELVSNWIKSKSQVVVRHLFFTNHTDANLYYERLKSGENFINLANELYRTSRFDSTAGLLGAIKYFSVDDQFAQTAFSLPVGSYSEPVESKWGIHIIKAENRIEERIRTEDQFNYARKGIESQLKLRKQRLQSKDVVSKVMLDSKPVFNEELVRSIEQTIKAILNVKIQNNPDQKADLIRFEQAETELFLQKYNPDQVVATYKIGSTLKEFTVKDLSFWITDTIASESLKRFGIILGRALRDELFYQEALSQEYDKDQRIKHDSLLRNDLFLGDLYMSKLLQSYIDNDSLFSKNKSLQESMMSKTPKTSSLKVSYFNKQFTSLNDARKTKLRLEKKVSTSNLKSEGFNQVQTTFSSTNSNYGLFSKMPVEKLNLHSSEDKFYLVYISKRSIVDEETDLSLKSTMKQFYASKIHVDSLRQQSTIKIDSTLFEQAMNFN